MIPAKTSSSDGVFSAPSGVGFGRCLPEKIYDTEVFLALFCCYDIIFLRGGGHVKKEKRKGYVAPILITVIMILYFIFYFGFLIAVLPGVWKYAFLLIPIAFAAVLIYVCVDRIKEIRSGEEDDLSKY